jgi:hypothetical protein
MKQRLLSGDSAISTQFAEFPTQTIALEKSANSLKTPNRRKAGSNTTTDQTKKIATRQSRRRGVEGVEDARS